MKKRLKRSMICFLTIKARGSQLDPNFSYSSFLAKSVLVSYHTNICRLKRLLKLVFDIHAF